ncbi:MAG TPA: DUF3105 domain-containing protein [Leptolyngbyaceae cyanobacterium]
MASGRRRKSETSSKVLSILLGPLGLVLVMGAVIGGLWYNNRPDHIAFNPGTPDGQAALKAVETFSDEGQKHVNPGQTVNYDTDFPTSGPHDPKPTMPGFYSEPQRPEQLVHSLEHGNIVIYYDQPTAEVQKTLASWVEQFPGAWDGLVVVPKSGLGETLVLTAWTKKLEMPQFDAEAAATFIDAYRGRGPENPVR